MARSMKRVSIILEAILQEEIFNLFDEIWVLEMFKKYHEGKTQ